MISTVLLVLLVLLALAFSALRNGQKTIQSLQMAKSMFTGMVGEIVGILALVGLVLTLIPETAIKSLLGHSSAFFSAVSGAVIGAVTILPAFVAFPLAASLVEKGAHLTAIAAFITTLTMVGFVTLPLEIRHFGVRFALVRNGLSLAFALLIAMGVAIAI